MTPVMPSLRSIQLLFIIAAIGPAAYARVLDDFDAPQRYGWRDIDFQVGSVSQSSGTLAFQLPAPRNIIFLASERVTEWFDLTNDTTIEFRVDLPQSNSPDAFALLAWVPEEQPVTAFRGYFLALSGTQIRIGKAIHKYFYDQKAPLALPAGNIQMVLTLTAGTTAVSIEGRFLDLSNNLALLFDQTVLDTSAQDPLQSGTDLPAAPYFGRGRFVLMEYIESSNFAPAVNTILFDNAQVSTPSPAHFLPVIHDISIRDRASFLSTSNISSLSFVASDTEPWNPREGAALIIGDQVWGHAMGVIFDDPNSIQAAGFSDYLPNTLNSVQLLAISPKGASNSLSLHFDTFSDTAVVIEAEEYENKNPQALVKTGPTLDYSRPQFSPAQNAFDSEINHIQKDDIFDYTRNFAPGLYQVFLRQSLLNIPQSEIALELSPTLPPIPGEPFLTLGKFSDTENNFLFTNAPLLDDSGTPTLVALSGFQTLRLHQLTPVPSDAELALNYLVLVYFSYIPQLESSPDVTGPYTPEPDAVVEGLHITIPFPQTVTRFYRINASLPCNITSLTQTANNLRLDYVFHD